MNCLVPRTRFSSASCRSLAVIVLLKAMASKPFRSRASVWSFIRAIRGLTTIVEPLSSRAGSWKQRLLPEPVGISTSVSRPARAERTAASCPGRNRRNPECSRSLDVKPNCKPSPVS